MAVSYNTSIVTNGLVLCLDAANAKSYPGTGTACYDLSTNAIPGTLIGSTSYSSTSKGIFSLNGTTSYINLPNFKNYFNFNSQFTISGWINKTNTSSADIVSSYNFTSDDGIWLEIGETSNIVRFASRKLGVNIFNLFSAEAIVINTWNNIVATFDGATAKIYINGIQSVNYASAVTLFAIANNDLNIGRLNDFYGRYFSGSLGPVSIYNRALTSTEIVKNFNALRGRYAL